MEILEFSSSDIVMGVAFTSSIALVKIESNLGIDLGLLTTIRMASRALLDRYLETTNIFGTPGSPEPAGLFQEWLSEINTIEPNPIRRIAINRWLLDRYVAIDTVTELTDGFHAKLVVKVDPLIDGVNVAQAQLIDAVFQSKSIFTGPEFLEWEEVSSAISFGEWDGRMAAQIGWSRDEFAFSVVDKLHTIGCQGQVLSLLRHLGWIHGLEVLLYLVRAWCAEKIARSFRSIL